MLASGGWDGTLVVWDVATRSVKWQQSVTGAGVMAVALSADDQQVFAAADDGFITSFRVQDGQQLHRWQAHRESCRCLIRLPGNRLASGGTDQLVKLWSAEGAALETHSGHIDWVESLALLPGEIGFASTGGDGQVRQWPLPNQNIEPVFAEAGGGQSLAASLDRPQLAASFGRESPSGMHARRARSVCSPLPIGKPSGRFL